MKQPFGQHLIGPAGCRSAISTDPPVWWASATPGAFAGAAAGIDRRTSHRRCLTPRLGAGETERSPGLVGGPLGRVRSRSTLARVTAVALAIDLLCWMRLLPFDGPLAKAEPATLLHAAARLVKRSRYLILLVPETWP